MLLQSKELIEKEQVRLSLTAFELPLDLPLDLESHLFQRAPNNLKGRPKRQLDFDAGRFCAGLGLGKFCLDKNVGIGLDRCPIWPTNTIGSISHSDRFVWSVVASESEYVSIGIDTEPIADELTIQHLNEEITFPKESQLVESLGFNRNEAFTIIFSAKESLYKCVYQVEPVFFGFHDVELTGLEQSTIKIRMNENNPNQAFAGQEFTIQFSVEGNDIFTACWLRQDKGH